MILYWIPKAVHWLVVLLPLLIIYAASKAVGLEAMFVYLAGACWYLYRTCLHPATGTNKVLQDPSPPLTKKMHVSTPQKKKRVAVIGCGPAGLVTCKELREEGHDVVCFEMSSKVGGEFAHGFWAGGKLTSSPYVTAFSDFEPLRHANGKEHWKHWTKEEYSSEKNFFNYSAFL